MSRAEMDFWTRQEAPVPLRGSPLVRTSWPGPISQ